jgi:hypothetical protein
MGDDKEWVKSELTQCYYRCGKLLAYIDNARSKPHSDAEELNQLETIVLKCAVLRLILNES